jgi:hypothetical protein
MGLRDEMARRRSKPLHILLSIHSRRFRWLPLAESSKVPNIRPRKFQKAPLAIIEDTTPSLSKRYACPNDACMTIMFISPDPNSPERSESRV